MKCTVVSIVPRNVTRNIPGVYPGEYTIPAAKEDIEVLVVNDAVTYVYVLNGSGFQRTEPGEVIANSIVNDSINSQLGNSPGAHLGLFYVEGAHTKESIKKNFSKELIDIAIAQKNLFENLVRNADDTWEKFHQHKMISDSERDACKWLKLKREWLYIVPEDKSTCPACGTTVNKGFPICFNCKAVIDKEAAKSLVFAS